jgi:hypothetical protein
VNKHGLSAPPRYDALLLLLLLHTAFLTELVLSVLIFLLTFNVSTGLLAPTRFTGMTFFTACRGWTQGYVTAFFSSATPASARKHEIITSHL